MRPGSSQVMTRKTTVIPAAPQPTARHRLVSGRPSGNSSSMNASRPVGNSTTNDQLTIHAAQIALPG